MEVISNRPYPVGLRVVVAEIREGDEFVAVNEQVEYDRESDDMVLTVTYKMRDGGLLWVITWLAVPNHDKRTVDSGLLLLVAAARLLRKAPYDDGVAARASGLIAEYLSRRPSEE